MAYDPLTGEGWDQEAAVAAWSESMDRVHHERHAPLRWQLHGGPDNWYWVFWNFGAWTGQVRIHDDGFWWHTKSYGTGLEICHGVTTSLWEAYQSIEQNRAVKR